ncbi:MAG: hypothetical protein ABMA01_20710, partial [Chthoniobacteraceae bacterium]
MKAMKPTLWILAAVAALLVLGLWLRRDLPNETQARRDFLAEHPTFTVERVTVDEQEVVAMSYRIFYRVPGDSALHEELRQYLYADGQWRAEEALPNAETNFLNLSPSGGHPGKD